MFDYKSRGDTFLGFLTFTREQHKLQDVVQITMVNRQPPKTIQTNLTTF